MTVNDGKGLYNNQGLCDTLKSDLNNLLKNMASGQYLQMSGLVVQMCQKLDNLKEGIAADLASKDRIIEELTKLNDELAEKQTGMPVERG